MFGILERFILRFCAMGMAFAISACSFDVNLSPVISADQALRKLLVTNGREIVLEEGQEYDVTVQIQSLDIPNLNYKPATLSWSLNDPDGDFENSSGEVAVSALDESVTFKIKPLKDAFVEPDEQFTLIFSGPFTALEDNVINITVLDRTTPAKIESSHLVLDFGAHLTHDSTDRVLTLSNTGDATAQDLTLSSPSAPYSYKGGSFPGLGGTCSTSLQGGHSCSLVISYSSDIAATHSENLSWNYSTPLDAANGSAELRGQSVEVIAILGGLPSSRSNIPALNVSVSGTDIVNYKYKLGPSSSINCAMSSGYSADLPISQRITNSLSSWPNQELRLCVLGQESHGIWQLFSQATSHVWFYDSTVPTVTIEKKLAQKSPAHDLPIEFTVTFSEAITGFTTQSIQQNGTASGITWSLTTTDNVTWSLQAIAISTDGTVIPSLPAGAVADLAGNLNTASQSADNIVIYDSIAPTLTINQRAGQADPTNQLPIRFTINFSEPIDPLTFNISSIQQTGSASGISWNLETVDNKVWTLSAQVVSTEGTLVPVLPAGSVKDAAGNWNQASLSTDNSVSYSTTAPNNASSLAWQENSPANTTLLHAEWVPSNSVLAMQRIQFFTGANCDTPYGTAIDLSGTDQTYPLTGSHGGVYTYKISSVDLASNDTESSCSASMLVDTTAPTILNVTSSRADGYYKAGTTIDIQVVFSEDVFVTGSPSLALNTTPARAATYLSGSGSSTLTFRYTVQSSDSSSPLNYASVNALTVSGASLRDEAGNNANLTLPGLTAAGSLATNKNLVIDTTAPVITAFTVMNTSPTNTVTYNLVSSVSGDPAEYCILENSTAVSGCTWASGTVFPTSFTVSATNNSKTLYAWMRDLAGNISTMSASNAVILDTVAPVINLTGFPLGNSAKYNLSIIPSGTDVITYKYKIGPSASTICSDSSNYSAETPIATTIVQNISALANGSITVCAVGRDTAGNWQTYSQATEKSWSKNTPTIQFTLTSSSVSEYDSPSHVVQVSIPAPVDVNVSVSYDFADGPLYPASKNSDYNATPGTATILAGNTTANIIIPIIDDIKYENNETFYVNLVSGTGATLGAQTQHLVTILDDDDPPLISIQDVYVIEGESTALRASLSATSDKGDVSISWSIDTCVGSNCAASPADYSMPATSGTATIPKGSTYVDFGTVHTVDNTVDESYRRIPIKITAVSGGTLLSGKANVVINDNDVPAGQSVQKIVTGYETACALTTSNKLYCWGKNINGQLGQGDSITRSTTVEVTLPSASPPIDIIASYHRHCALTAEGEVYCWGYSGNSSTGYGMVGNNSINSQTRPVLVYNLGKDVSAFSMGYYATCALKNSAMYCWGSNYSAVVGGAKTDPAVVTLAPTAMPAPLDQNISKVSLGSAHACAIIAKEVYCWGNNNNGELGRGVTHPQSSPQPTPAKVVGLSNNIVDVWAGYYATCAKAETGEVYCWGRNSEAQLTGTGGSAILTATRMPDFDNADKIVPQRTLCMLRNGELLCRGHNIYGSAGVNAAGTPFITTLTNPIGAESNVTNVDVGPNNGYMCFVRSGQMYCTGYAGAGNLGDDYIPVYSTPQLANGISGVGGAQSINMGITHGCGLFAGAVKCWGWNETYRSGNQSPEIFYMEPTPVKGLTSGYTSVTTTTTASCALHSSGELKCWGHYAIRGVSSTVSNGNPVTPTGMDAGVTKVFGGPTNNEVCAIKDNQTYCWGANDYGAIGNGTVGVVTAPFKVPDSADVIDVAQASYAACLLKSTGKVYCSGTNQYGVLGQGDTVNRYTFTEVPGLTNIIRVAAINGSVCALNNTNQVYCWGRTIPLGTSSTKSSPTLIPALAGTTEIYGAGDNYCAKVQNEWKCWGSNSFGQAWNGIISDVYTYVPTTMGFSELGVPSKVMTFQNKICAKIGDDYYCAGLESYTEFTRNNKPYRLAPISVRPFNQ